MPDPDDLRHLLLRVPRSVCASGLSVEALCLDHASPSGIVPNEDGQPLRAVQLEDALDALLVVMLLPCASLTAYHDKFQTLMTDAIYSCSRPW